MEIDDRSPNLNQFEKLEECYFPATLFFRFPALSTMYQNSLFIAHAKDGHNRMNIYLVYQILSLIRSRPTSNQKHFSLQAFYKKNYTVVSTSDQFFQLSSVVKYELVIIVIVQRSCYSWRRLATLVEGMVWYDYNDTKTYKKPSKAP